MATSKKVLAGSARLEFNGAKSIGPVADGERFEVTVRLRRRKSLATLQARGVHDDTKPGARRYLTHEEYEREHGADPVDVALIEKFAKEHGLVVVAHDLGRRSVFISGTAVAFAQAFDTKIEYFEHEGGVYRGRTGSLSVPSEIADAVEGVFGIDNRPMAKPHYQHQQGGIQAHTAGTSFTPPQLAKCYGFPSGADGTGQCIAIIELGGGFRTADITPYFTGLGLPVPTVVAVGVDGGTNSPSNANSADGEVMLDIEVAAAIAPKAKIAVYFAPNTDKGFLDAITKAIHDTSNKPSVISISWGSAEKNWTTQSMTTFDQAFQTAAALGVTVCVASGDNGAKDGVTDGKYHVDFPASSPFALGCGGTKLACSGTAISSEVVWNENPTTSATGGGVSEFFALPAYQASAGVPVSLNSPRFKGRGVPDVAGDADPNSGYVVRVDGQNMVIGGTSAVAPLWAGLVALLNQKLGHHVGYLNPLIYGSFTGKGCFRDITSGGNGGYNAKAGWDPCTGMGSPVGSKILAAL